MEQLKRIRERKGLSQAKLAQLAGLNPITVHRIEHGHKSPTVKTLDSLAQALGVEVGDFFPIVQPQLPFEVQRKSLIEPEHLIDYFRGTRELDMSGFTDEERKAIEEMTRQFVEMLRGGTKEVETTDSERQ